MKYQIVRKYKGVDIVLFESKDRIEVGYALEELQSEQSHWHVQLKVIKEENNERQIKTTSQNPSINH